MTEAEFAEHYAHLTDGELAKLATARRNLVQAARASLDREIEKRGLTTEALKRFANDRHNYHVDPREDDRLAASVRGKLRRSKLLERVNALRKIPRLGWKAILAGIALSFAFCMVFDHFGRLDWARPVLGSAVVLWFALRSHWDLKGKVWFWAVIGIWAALHMWMVREVRWPSGWVPASVLSGAATIDLIALFLAIALFEKLLHQGRYAKVSPAENR